MLLVILITFILRIPSFFEPYWYGDEGIYLAIGQALQRGAILYRDIWDNKPPLLYLIYAIIPTLLWAKITATACVLGTVCFIQKITKNNLAALICGILLSIPLFEGTIANAELYFILPVVIAAFGVIARSVATRQSSPGDERLLRFARNDIVIGILLTIAFLIKVPAVFDFMGLFLAWFIINRKIKPFFIISLPFLLSLLSFIIYFYFNNALSDFITAVFVQNSSYVAIDSGPLSKLSNPLFIKGLMLLLTSFILFILFIKNKITKELLIFSMWFCFSLYGALLSNRPYLHYLLQIVPPSVILGFYLLKNLKKYFVFFIPLIFVFYYLYINFGNAFRLPTKYYYENFFQYITKQKSRENYANWFDSRTTTNYQIANFLRTPNSEIRTLFVWGDNAFIYVLSKIPPTTKFIQAYHLTTIDKSNYDKIIDQINFKKPKYIIVIRPVRFEFLKLEELISKKYKLVNIFGDSYVYEMLGNITDETANHVLGPGAKK